MKAVFQKCLGDLEMGRVRCGNCHEVDPVIAPLFTLQHVLPTAIGAVTKAKPLTIFTALFGPMIQSAGGEFEQTVKARPQAVGRPDLTAFATANHTPFQFRHMSVSVRRVLCACALEFWVALDQKPMDCK